MLDDYFEAFVSAYPESRRQRGFMAQQAFTAGIQKAGFDVIMAALAQHKRSDQWRTVSLIPMMKKWLEEERWIQVLPEDDAPAPVARADSLTPFERARRAGLK